MCIGGQKDQSGAQREEAARIEAERQARIAGGTAKIDENFANFNDDFYGTKTKAYNDFYLPEIDTQYKAANDDLINHLGANLSGSEGAKQIGNLAKQYERQKASYAQNGIDYANDIKSNLATTRAQLISQLEGGGSIINAGDQARIAAQNYASSKQFSPLASLFSSASGQAANAVIAPNYGYAPIQTGLFNPKGKAGSVSNVA